MPRVSLFCWQDWCPEPKGLVLEANLSVDGSKEMQHDIAAHLESIALLSLPEQKEVDNAASDEVQSESAKISRPSEDQDQESLFLTSDVWDEHNLARKKEYDVESINGALPLEIIERLLDPIPMTENEDWSYVKSTTRPRALHLDPGQDPVLLLFVERARRIQTLELQKRLGIPLIVISDPSGLEVPEEQWSGAVTG